MTTLEIDERAIKILAGTGIGLTEFALINFVESFAAVGKGFELSSETLLCGPAAPDQIGVDQPAEAFVRATFANQSRRFSVLEHRLKRGGDRSPGRGRKSCFS